MDRESLLYFATHAVIQSLLCNRRAIVEAYNLARIGASGHATTAFARSISDLVIRPPRIRRRRRLPIASWELARELFLNRI